MTGRFLYLCIICLTRLVNSFLFRLLLVLRSVPVDLVDLVPDSGWPGSVVPGSAGPGLVAPGSIGPVVSDLSGKHVEGSGNFFFEGACSTATF